MSMLAPPFQLLEINMISAQDLAPVSKSMKAYAVAWLNPERKLTTQIDPDGHNNPTWNEKFVFRVDDDFLQAEDSVIMIEIYASAWLRDVLIGTVGVLLTNLLPRSNINHRNKSNKVRFVALQVRRPSGRPQGILNIGVNLVDATMRSMPMYSELSSSAVEYWDIMDPKKDLQKHNQNHESTPSHGHVLDVSKLMTLQRSQSEKNDSSTVNEYPAYKPGGKNGYGNDHDQYHYQGGDSEVGVPVAAKKGGIVNANGSLCSDVGPSPSVVAAAIAKGLYPLPMPMPMPRKAVNLVLEDWPPEKGPIGAEGLNTKIERWRSGEMPAVYDHLGQNNNNNSNGQKKVVKATGKGKEGGKNQRRAGGGLFSCFGTAMGCEISITCGGGGNRKKGNGKPRVTTASELTFDESSYV